MRAGPVRTSLVRGGRVLRGHAQPAGSDERRAERHGRLRLVEAGGNDPELLGDQAAHERQPARPADEMDVGQLSGGHPRRAHGTFQQLHAAQHRRTHERLELGAGDEHVGERLRHRHLGPRQPGQRLLGRADVLGQGPARPAVRRGLGAQQALPALRVAVRDLAADVHEQRLVDVEAAEVRQPVLGEHGEAVGGGAEDGDVEGARSEVVHREGAAGFQHRAGERGEVRRRGDRFGHQKHVLAHPGGPGGTQQNGAPYRAPLGRVGEPDLAGRDASELAHRLVVHAAQHRGQRVGDRDDVGAEQQGLLVDAALRVGFETGRVEPRAPLSLPPDHQVPALLGEHGRRHRRGPVELDHPGCPSGRREHRDGVGCPEVDGQHPHQFSLVVLPQDRR